MSPSLILSFPISKMRDLKQMASQFWDSVILSKKTQFWKLIITVAVLFH
jgi:hypothetical protein